MAFSSTFKDKENLQDHYKPLSHFEFGAELFPP